MDLQIDIWLQSIHNPIFDAIGQLLNFLGEKGWIFIAIAIGLIINKSTRSAGIVLFIALALTGLCTEVIKELIERPRPFVAYPSIEPLYHEESLYSSFPSGHTSMAFAFATIIAIFYKQWKYIVFGMAFLMGFSRMYGFVHYPTDVIAGAIVGIVCALVVFNGYKALKKRNKNK